LGAAATRRASAAAHAALAGWRTMLAKDRAAILRRLFDLMIAHTDDLAAIIGRSRSHVLKLFRRHMSTSAKGYVIGRQLQEARELLLSTTLPIAEVGKAVGLPDPYHFSKLFRRHTGLAPREYRSKHGPFSTPPTPSSHAVVPPETSS
jgi:AraC-like DNA-binding protein